MVAIKISSKSGIPALLLFLTLGIIFNFLGVEFNNYYLADKASYVSGQVIGVNGGYLD